MLPKRAVLYTRATKSVGFVAEESLHPYVILPYTHGQQKWTEVSPERVVPHSRATKMDRSVTQACRAAPSSDKKARNCCLKVSYCTLGRRKCSEVSPESVVLHPRATKMLGSVTQACRILLLGDEKYGFRCRRVPFILTSFCLAPFGNENGLKCCLKVSRCTLGRRRSAEVSLKRAVLHSWATILGYNVA